MRAIDPLFAPAPGFAPLPATARPPARVRLEKIASTSQNKLGGWANGLDNSPNAALLWSDDARWARLVKNERVTREDWYQDVREIELELEGVTPEERDRLYACLKPAHNNIALTARGSPDTRQATCSRSAPATRRRTSTASCRQLAGPTSPMSPTWCILHL